MSQETERQSERERERERDKGGGGACGCRVDQNKHRVPSRRRAWFSQSDTELNLHCSVQSRKTLTRHPGTTSSCVCFFFLSFPFFPPPPPPLISSLISLPLLPSFLSFFLISLLRPSASLLYLPSRLCTVHRSAAFFTPALSFIIEQH